MPAASARYGSARRSESVVHAALTAGSRILIAPAYFDLPGTGWRSALAAIDTWIDADGDVALPLLAAVPADPIESCNAPARPCCVPRPKWPGVRPGPSRTVRGGSPVLRQPPSAMTVRTPCDVPVAGTRTAFS